MPADTSATDLLTVAQVRALDCAVIAAGIPGFELMSRAARAGYVALRRHWPAAQHVLVLAGPGNNGGDAFLLAALAKSDGLEVMVWSPFGAAQGADAQRARAAWVAAGGAFAHGDATDELAGVDVVVDGLFGTGGGRALDGVARELVARIAARGLPVLALDVPSGLDADTGVAADAAVRAEVTVSFIAWKRGLFSADGADCCGRRELATLDVPAASRIAIGRDAELLTRAALDVLSPRSGNVNKGNFGHVLVVGGDDGMGGAVRLAAEAALRTGAGLVSVATRAQHVGALNAARPELMARGVECPQALAPMLERASVVALGPGLGQGAWSHALWDTTLRSARAAVIDADALNLLARTPIDLPASTVLTPHPGEAGRLLGSDAASVQRDRFAAARELARRCARVVVLKGAGSLVAAPEGRIAVCPFGNPGMATAGMGDVLSGVIAALLAQGLDAWEAACAGVVAHALAGDAAAGSSPRGLVAG
ncbi:MAG: NAD(P)H-hydrate dehydratase, partial [Dokdonella sp.]|nr:NAD(P)H-hydrate dehydratase [Dokdonella sp.]